MRLGRIVGTVVSTRKDEKIVGLKLYVVRDLSLDMADKASFVVAADSVGAGIGELGADVGKRVGRGVGKRVGRRVG